MRTNAPIWFLPILLVCMPWQSVSAAPQILAVLSSEDGVSLTCTDGVCEADLSTYCLQRPRPAPAYGDVYVPAAPGQFTLVVTDSSGRERRFSASHQLTFSERRGYTAVSAHMPEMKLLGLGGVNARLVIAANASLVPLPVAGDSHPQSPDEIKQATGPSRTIGTLAVDNTPKGRAARVLGSMVNALPREGREDSGRYEALWRKAASPYGRGTDLGPARQAFEQCTRSLHHQAVYALRGCLTIHHDKLMRDLSVRYWNAGAGS